MRISDWSSDVCSSDLERQSTGAHADAGVGIVDDRAVIGVEGRLAGHAGQAVVVDMDIAETVAGADVEVSHPRGNGRAEARRVGQECAGTCNSRWSPDHQKKKK